MTRFPLVVSLIAGVVLAGHAVAQPAPAAADEAQAMRDLLTGTLEIDNPAGNWSAKRYYAPDHTYREIGSDGEVHGTWVIENGKICATASRALGADRAAKYCNVGLGKHFGETWRDSDPVTDNTVLFKLSAGRS